MRNEEQHKKSRFRRHTNRFLKYFVFLFILNLAFNLLFKSAPDWLNALSIALGISFGLIFFDMMSARKK